MRVLHLIDSLGPGGAERSLIELLPFYREAGIESTVVCLKDHDTGFVEEVRDLGIRLHCLPGNSLRAWIPAFRNYVREEQPDLVHTCLFLADLVGRIAAIGTQVPILSSLVNTSYDPVRARDPNLNRHAFRLVRMVDGFTARHFVTHFHAVTNAVKESYEAALRIPSERITVIERGRARDRLGFATVERRRRVRRSLDVAEERFVLLNVGRHEYQKGQQYLIQAMSDLCVDRPEVLLLIAGSVGAQTRCLELAVSRYGVEDHVRFLGYREDVADLMAAADLFVFPSLFEGIGGAVIEAMGLGLPIIASDIRVLREVLGEDAGVFAAPGSPSAISGRIREVLRQPDRARELGRVASTRFEERFEICKTAVRMVELYREVASLRRRIAST